MARAKIPAPLDRRHLLQGEIAPAQALGIADAYLNDGRQLEAVDFLIKADATEKLQALLEEAIEAGDAFLVRMVSSALGSTPEPADWKRVEAAARAAGKDLYAETAKRQAEIEEGGE